MKKYHHFLYFNVCEEESQVYEVKDPYTDSTVMTLARIKSAKNGELDKNDILEGTKDNHDENNNQKVFVSFFSITKNGVLKRQNIMIYVDKTYTNHDNMIIDIINECISISYFFEQEFVSLIEYKVQK